MLVLVEEPDADLLGNDLSSDEVLRGQAIPHLGTDSIKIKFQNGLISWKIFAVLLSSFI